MDVFPWPDGLGFTNAASWREYVRNQDEEKKLEILMATALLSDEVCQLLLNHEPTLLDAFQLSELTITLLSSIEATTLTAFAAALLLKQETLCRGNGNR